MKKRDRPKIRKLWTINPKTRIKESLKRYKRQKAKRGLRDTIEEIKGIDDGKGS